MQKVKERKNIPVVIVEDHHEVVPYIHRDIASKHLPFSDLTLVHFDSHPDMLIPVDMAADSVFEKEKLYGIQSIENWIVPQIYAGHISRVYWLKPPWCFQIDDKDITFYVGMCRDTGKIRTSCKENYFVSETLYVHESRLENKKAVSFHVRTIIPKDWDQVTCDKQTRTDVSKHEGATPNPSAVNTDKIISNSVSSPDGSMSSRPSENQSNLYLCLEDLARNLDPKSFILDIDLDFYSTKNPFKELYSKEQLVILKQLYSYASPADDSEEALQKCVNHRTDQLSSLKTTLISLSKDINTSCDIEESKCELLKELVSSLQSQDPNTDFELVHEAGCTMDDTELPHHVSTERQICSLVQETKQVLEVLPHPALITVSRSSVDDYCPPDQVDYIEEAITLALEEVYVYTDIQRHYDISDDNDPDKPSTSANS